MKAIILAAGKGTRLDGAAVKPKCLVEIGGVTLLHRQIETLRSQNINKIVVVIGFAADSIREECGDEITFVENIHFAETSSLYSLWLARDHLTDGFVVMNSDVLFHPQLLANLLDSSYDDALLISDTETTPLGDEEMKVKVKEDLVVDISKHIDPLEADGENVGIVKFGPTGAKALLDYMDELIAGGAVKEWVPRAFREFALNHPLHALSTGGLPWIEIDFPEDYQRAVTEIYPRIESQGTAWSSASTHPYIRPLFLSMSLKSVISTARGLDKQWQRWRSPERRRLLVNARTAMNYATLAPMIERLQRDERLELYFTSSESPALTEAIYAEAVQPYTFATPVQASLMQFDVYLAADFLWLNLLRGASRVQTFHGVAGKYRTVYDSPSENMRSWDRFFFINERRLRHFIECGAIDDGSPAVRLIGMPKLDCLVDGSLKRDVLLTAMGIDPARKTILYAPTWSPHSSVVSMGEELVQRLGEAGYAVIVKLHDRSRDLQYINSGGVDWGERLEPLLQSFGGVLATGNNSSRYLPAADIMITDHSSVGFEYLLLDRPLIRIHLPELIQNTDIEPSYVDLLAQASTSVTNIDDVITAVEQCFAQPDENSDSRLRVANEMFYKPGTATDRAVKELYELMELDAISRP